MKCTNCGYWNHSTHCSHCGENLSNKKETKMWERIRQLQRMPYKDYLMTPEWKKTRLKAIKRAGARCQLCNREGILNVHHRTYNRRGHEHIGDLIVLCQGCHSDFHNRVKK